MPPRTVAILSDTHLPRGTRRLPARCLEHLEAAELILHVGDLTTLALLEELRRHGEVRAVAGNADDAATRAALPPRLELELDGRAAGRPLRLGVIHDAGPARGRLARLQRALPDAAAVVYGHSHIPWLERDPVSGVQIFNPGSPTDKRRQPAFTMGWAEVTADGIAFRLLELPAPR